MPRPYWTGQIRLNLVSIPVQLYTATQGGAKVSFRQIHQPSGKPIRYEKVAPGVGPVDPDEILKGYEVQKGSYVLLEQEEIDAVKLESKRTLALTQFVDQHEISVLYFDKPYYVVPADELAEEAFIVLREALRRTKKAGLGQLAMRGREYVVCLRPCDKGMVLETLRYADEVRKAEGFFGEIPDDAPDKDMLDLAETLIKKKTAPFDPEEFHDRYAEALHGLVEKKRKAKGARVLEDVEETETAAKGGNVIDLMAALKKSVAKEKGGAAATGKSGRQRKRA